MSPRVSGSGVVFGPGEALVRSGGSGGQRAEAGEDLGEQMVPVRQAQHERAGVVYEASGDADHPVLQGFDHRFAACDAQPDQRGRSLGRGLVGLGGGVLAGGVGVQIAAGGGELMQPSGEAGGDQRAPHPGGVDGPVARG